MSQLNVTRRCTGLLGVIAAAVEHATAFGPEARHMHQGLNELRPLLDELLTGKVQEPSIGNIALEEIEAALENFAAAAKRCCSQGPLETVFAGDQLLHQLVDSCLRVRRGLAQIQQQSQLPTVVRAQATMLSAQLNTCTINYETLRRLQSVRFQLQEEAERVRLDVCDGDGAFTSQIQRLAASCTPQQLTSDIAFLTRRSEEAEAGQQVVTAHLLQLALGVVRALTAARASDPRQAVESEAWGHPDCSSWRTAASPSSPRAAPGQSTPPGGVAGALSQLNASSSTSNAGRVSLLSALCRALEGPERSHDGQVFVAEGGVGAMLRLMAIGAPGLRSGALRVLLALLAAEPAYGGELVAARGVPVLMHTLNACLDENLKRSESAAARQAAATAQAEAEVVTLRLAARSPARKAGPGGAVVDGRRDAKAAVLQPPVQQSTENDESSGSGKEGEGGNEEVCLLAVTLLRHLSQSRPDDLVAAGAVKALCRMTGMVGAGRLAGAAATALTDLASDGQAATQMLQDRVLVSLSSLRLSDRPSESAAAVACMGALLQHPARLLDPGHAPQDAQLCAELGRACDAASLSALLDLAVERAAAANDQAGNRCAANIEPGLWQLLPFCVHSTEARSAVLRHSEAMRLLLARVADGDAAAAATLRRVGNDDVSKTAVALQLAQALAAGSSALSASCKRVGALVLCLADVLRPASRDRTALRWSSDACGEVEQSGLVPQLLAITSSQDPASRAAGLAALHALAVYGTRAVRTTLGAAGGVMCLADAVKLEGVALPVWAGTLSLLQPPMCEPRTLGQAAAEALAALATESDALRRDVTMQLAAFLGSPSPHLAASTCMALLGLLEAAPAAGPLLVEHSVMPTLVAHLSKGNSPSLSPYTAARSANSSAQCVGGNSATAAHGEPESALELLQQRAVRLLWALCRGGGSAVEVAVAAGAPRVLLQRVTSSGGTTGSATALRVEAAAALGPLLKKSAAAREAVDGAGGLAALMELARGGVAAAMAAGVLPLWEEAMGAIAALAALHAPCRAEAARALRQMLLRGRAREAAGAAMIVERLSSAAAGREAVLAEELADPLVRLLSSGDDRAKAAAANAICHLAVPPTVALPPCAALPAGGAIRPRMVLVRAGAAPALLTLLRDAGEAPGPSSASSGSASSSSQASSAAAAGAAQVCPGDAAIVAAAEALESLARGEEGAKAIRSFGGVEILKATVAGGKRRLVPAAAAKAASAALLHCV